MPRAPEGGYLKHLNDAYNLWIVAYTTIQLIDVQMNLGFKNDCIKNCNPNGALGTIEDILILSNN